MANIKAVILDLDGVITDTAEFHFEAWKKMADEEGVSFDRKKNENLKGVSRRQSLEILLGDFVKNFQEQELVEMMARKNRYYQDMLQTITHEDFLPGAVELVEAIKSCRLKTAIGSASKNAKTVLSHLGAMQMFDAIADGYCVVRAKPAPDIFLYAAGALSVPAENCAVIEDAASGVQAAITAGMLAVGIGSVEHVGHAHFCYPTTADIQLQQILG